MTTTIKQKEAEFPSGGLLQRYVYNQQNSIPHSESNKLFVMFKWLDCDTNLHNSYTNNKTILIVNWVETSVYRTVPMNPSTYWRVSGASETLSGVTQLKIGDICLFMCGCTYVILYFDPRVLLCSLCVRPRPKLN